MKRILSAVLVLIVLGAVLIVPALADAPLHDWGPITETGYYVIVDGDGGYVNFRSGPGTAYDILHEIYDGTVLYVEAETYNSSSLWCQVEHNGYYGWVAYSQLSESFSQLYTGGSTPSGGSYYVRVTASDGVNFRYGPGTYYAKRTSTVPTGYEFIITKEAYDAYGWCWGYTTYQGYDGWIALSEVSTISPPTPDPTAKPTPDPTPKPTAEPTDKPDPTKNPAPEDEPEIGTPVIHTAAPQVTMRPSSGQNSGMTLATKLILLIFIVLLLIIVSLVVLLVMTSRNKRRNRY